MYRVKAHSVYKKCNQEKKESQHAKHKECTKEEKSTNNSKNFRKQPRRPYQRVGCVWLKLLTNLACFLKNYILFYWQINKKYSNINTLYHIFRWCNVLHRRSFKLNMMATVTVLASFRVVIKILRYCAENQDEKK